MASTLADLTEIARRLADRKPGRTEANVQSDLHMMLATAPLALQPHELIDIVLESPAGQRRRIDVEVGFTVFEVKRDLRVGKVRHDAVDQLAGYVLSQSENTGQRYVGVLTDGAEWPYGALVVAAWRGREPEVIALAAAATAEMTARGEGQWLTAGAWATALLHNGLGRYDDARTAAERGSAYPDELGLASWSMVELVEAAARSGRPERAADAVRRLTEIADACGTDWAGGVQARSRALLCEGEEAERAHREAIARLGRTRVRSGLARAHLLYGEWLRRENRRVDARVQLRLAHDMLTAMGAEAFAERARRELLATGETVRKRSVERVTDLTEQEAQIARLAVGGHTNPEIGTRLFLSPRTVEWHLRKVFGKLGVGSRKELREALQGDAPVRLPA